MKNTIAKLSLSTFICCTALTPALSQLTISGQLRTRSELKDGQGTLLSKGAQPASFTSQRTRLNLDYKMDRLEFGLSLQDVRVWGQDVSTINRTTTANNNGLKLQQAWADILLSNPDVKNKSFSLKIGRQELSYDDQRLLGALDWLQQGRSHDAALLKYQDASWMVNLGAAENQNKENASGTIYVSTPPGNYTANTNGGAMYKSLQFFYAGKKLKKGAASFLFLADQFNKYELDNADTKNYENGGWGRMTTGLYFNNSFDNLNMTASAYYQFGNNPIGQKLSAGLLSLYTNYNFNKKFSLGPGVDYTSGGNSGNTSHNFDPLYGTPHKFWGSMDYFYVASPFGINGLLDYYLKATYKTADKFILSGGLHQFNSAKEISSYDVNGRKKKFGTETDLTGNYQLNKAIGFEAGYSHFFATPLLASSSVKNVANASLNANWAYLMINITPDFLTYKY